MMPFVNPRIQELEMQESVSTVRPEFDPEEHQNTISKERHPRLGVIPVAFEEGVVQMTEEDGTSHCPRAPCIEAPPTHLFLMQVCRELLLWLAFPLLWTMRKLVVEPDSQA